MKLHIRYFQLTIAPRYHCPFNYYRYEDLYHLTPWCRCEHAAGV